MFILLFLKFWLLLFGQLLNITSSLFLTWNKRKFIVWDEVVPQYSIASNSSNLVFDTFWYQNIVSVFVWYSMCCKRKWQTASEDGQQVGPAGKVADIGEGINGKSLLAKAKGHVVNHMVCHPSFFVLFAPSRINYWGTTVERKWQSIGKSLGLGLFLKKIVFMHCICCTFL